jgi:hypothetical protein
MMKNVKDWVCAQEQTFDYLAGGWLFITGTPDSSKEREPAAAFRCIFFQYTQILCFDVFSGKKLVQRRRDPL